MSKETEREYEFKIAISSRVMLLLCCLPLSIIAIAFLAGWSDSLGVGLLSFVLVIGLFIKLLLSWAFKKEKISFGADGFESAVYGRVDFSEVQEATIPWYMARPSLKLYLRSGKSCSWALRTNSEVQKALAGEHPFNHFLDKLQRKLAVYESQAATAHAPSATERTATASIRPPQQQVASQLEGLKELSRKPGFTIPIGLAFAVLGLVCACGADWLKSDEPNFTAMHESSAELYDHYVSQAKTVLDRKLETEGRLFLYTNDTTATATLYPEVETTNPTGIAAFEYNSGIESLRAFVNNPDSVELQIYVVAGDSTVQKMGLSFYNYGDSASQYLYLRAYDPSQKIKPMRSHSSQVATDSSDYRKFDLQWGVPLTDTTENLQQSISTSLPGMHMMLAQVKHRENFKLYMCGREKQGIDETRFRNSIRALNRLLHQVNADTSGFVLKVVNGK